MVIALKDTSPPTLAITLTPSVLWPPNDRMVTLTATIDVHDDTDPAPRIELVSITSNGPDDKRGGRHSAPDIQGAAIGTDDRSFQLRAERFGGKKTRVYAIVYRAIDAAGNTREATTYVIVEH